MEWNSEYADCHIMKLLMRNSPPVLMTRSGSDPPDVYRYLENIASSMSSGSILSATSRRAAFTISSRPP